MKPSRRTIRWYLGAGSVLAIVGVWLMYPAIRFEWLRYRLSSGSWKTRAESVMALGEPGPYADRSIPLIIGAIEGDDDTIVRLEAIHALARVDPDSPRTLQVALHQMRSAPDSLVGRTAFRLIVGPAYLKAGGPVGIDEMMEHFTAAGPDQKTWQELLADFLAKKGKHVPSMAPRILKALEQAWLSEPEGRRLVGVGNAIHTLDPVRANELGIVFAEPYVPLGCYVETEWAFTKWVKDAFR